MIGQGAKATSISHSFPIIFPMKSLELQVISSILADLETKMTAWLVASVINVSGTHQWAWNEDERRALVRKQIMIRNLSSQSIVSISN